MAEYSWRMKIGELEEAHAALRTWDGVATAREKSQPYKARHARARNLATNTQVIV